MKKQVGGISTGLVAVLAILVVLIIGGLMGLATYVSAHNYANSMENQLKAAQTDAKNVFAQYGQKVLEITQVPEMYRDDLVKVVTAAIEGRYGPDGSKATFQWIQEQNPTVDPSMYIKIQQVIEAGRDDFTAAQRRQIDIRRQYETALGNFWQGMWMKFAGYPKVNLADFDIVSTDRADEAFKNKKESGPIQLRRTADTSGPE